MKPLNLTEKKEFYSALYYLYSAGFSYTEAFGSAARSSKRASVNLLCTQIVKEIEKGTPFRDIITSYKEVIGESYAMLLCAGDMSGKLDEALTSILKDITRIENMKNMLISSLTYPVLLLFGAIGVFFFCQFFFFRIFDVMFTTGMCSSGITVLFITAIIKIIIIYALIFVFIFLIAKNRRAYQKLINLVAEQTFLSKVVNNYYYYNFFSVMAASYEAGVPVTDSVTLAASVLKTRRSFLGIYKISSLLQKGNDITGAFVSSGLFSDFAMSQIAVGEKTGKLGEAFQRIASDYERNLQETVNYVSRLINPLAIVITGVLVGYIALAFYQRLYGGLLNAF